MVVFKRANASSDVSVLNGQDELVDVPAAIVCAGCGSADCPGCSAGDEHSGIVAIVAWERRDVSVMTRFWLTARATTRTADSFFQSLPDGAVLPALRFAILAEVVASTAMASIAAAVAVIALPHAIPALMTDPGARSLAFNLFVGSVMGTSVLLLAAHVAHALVIDAAARLSGRSGRRAHALRFGLYSAGWDVMLGPVGLAVALVGGGFRGVAQLLEQARGLPRRASGAFLSASYKLQGVAARGPLIVAGTAAALLAVVCAVVILSLMAMASLVPAGGALP